ncbi:hypothetical protein D0C36_24030 [Mucilaginibacter conchicola]|uniref:Restriction endonuclease type IV Mrr domain-containing protein n=1 Tax=Mucilaginibacter conchicola TaxID=2303333 RepID=A0A372NNF7_9SPHI|nr:restriction endonuclease [Mucilaginibacter conchicola]RFZ89915.1 hypothetical protein D0C36_24030 [Mucilaginibacter conchicola]
MARKNDGKQLERLVGLIHEAIKESSGTIVQTNVKLKNTSGVLREFDIIIRSIVSDVEIVIAIECKDYTKAVGVEKLEAFKGKCDRIPLISKKVFVSPSGYQRDAINAAKDFGITLYELKDIAAEDIASWFLFQQIGIRFEVTDYQIHLSERTIVDKLNSYKKKVWFYAFDEKVNLLAFLNEEIKSKREEIWSIKLRSFIRAKEEDRFEKECYRINFTFEPGCAKLETEDDEIFLIQMISVAVDIWMIKVETKIISTKAYTSDEGKQTGYMEIDVTNSGKVEIIVANNRYNIFHTDESGQKQKMEMLGKYDPKNDTYVKISKEKT